MQTNSPNSQPSPLQIVNRNLPTQSGEVALHALCKNVLQGRRLIIASNRGPVTYTRGLKGDLVAERGSGGVVTALSALTRYTPVTWVAAALSAPDREMAHTACDSQDVQNRLRLRFVDIPDAVFSPYLNAISNPLLWFLQHGMIDTLQHIPDEAEIMAQWHTGYVAANQAFAGTIVAASKSSDTAPIVVFHDYHLYLAPGMVRHIHPHLTLMHFTHIPWPQPGVWGNLPVSLVQAICESLLACDIVGFQTPDDAAAFAQTCAAYLADAHFHDEGKDGFRVERRSVPGKPTLVRAYPISIDPEQVMHAAFAKPAVEWRARLVRMSGAGRKIIVRVDRLDPSKNICAGFTAYAHLLETNPHVRGKIVFLALLVPSRESVAEYAAYKAEIFHQVASINTRFGTAHWQPIRMIYGNDYNRSLAAMSLADVILVNPIADGMNLVAKESVIVNSRDAVLVLSNTAGAWHELGHAALSINPHDCAGIASALLRALTMPEGERVVRARALAQSVEAHDLTQWLAHQLRDVCARKTLRHMPSLTPRARVMH